MAKTAVSIKEIINNAIKEKRDFLMEYESKLILKHIDVPFPNFIIAKNEREAVDAAEKLGYPVVLKIVSPNILHKTEYGGVILNIKNKKEVAKSYRELINNVKGHSQSIEIEGVMVYKMAPPGILELIVGVSFDTQFAHNIMVGLGGVFVELFKDVSIRLIPITNKDAEEMLKELKSYPILMGYRNNPKSDITAIKKLLLKISDLIVENPEIKEIDLNPVIVYGKGLAVVDARMFIG
ncbi:MAG: acetate--CoA ligase family protein [Candidatus Odinarchaeia archaeon]